MRTPLRRFAIFLLACYLGIVGVLYLSQRRLMFFPDPTRRLPADFGLTNIDEVTLTTRSREERICWFAKTEAADPVILLTHGNAGNASFRTGKYRQFNEGGFNVFCVGYPGYGGSDGRPSEAGMVESAMLAYDYLIEIGYPPDQIILYGESIGTAVAVQVAASKNARALILEAPMSSVREIAADAYPLVPVRWLLKDPFLSIEHIKHVDEPLLVIHGDRDAVIPITSGQKLFAAANEPKQFLVINDGGHNDLYQHSIVPLVSKFLQSIDNPKSD